MTNTPELDKIEDSIDQVVVERTGSAVDYTPLIKIALRLVILWMRHRK